MKETFILRTENRPIIERLSDEEAGALFKALMLHAEGEEVDLDSLPGKADVAYMQMAAQMDRMDAAYQEKVENRRKAGLKSAEVRANKGQQSSTDFNKVQQTSTKGKQKSTIPVPVPVPVPVSHKGDYRERRFTPPTLEEVVAYAEENKLGLDCERFIDFYTSKGWMVGKTKMKDWKAAARNWARPKESEQKKDEFDYNTILSELDRIRREQDAEVQKPDSDDG